jgi:hypothetical protein
MQFKKVVLAGFCVLMAPLSVLAQGQFTPRARELFVTQKADGLEVTVKWMDRNGQFTVIDPSREFKKGDHLRVEFRSNFDGIVYFLNVTPRGVLKVIHRDTVRADTVNALPTGPNTIQFDNEPGVEALKIILARQPIDEFETAMSRSGGMLGKTGAGVVDELSQSKGQKTAPNRPPASNVPYKAQSNRVSEEVGIVTPRPGQECGGLELSVGGKKLNCRGMIVAKGDERRGQGAVFVASSTPAKSGGGAMQSSDVAVMELRFRHIRVPE